MKPHAFLAWLRYAQAKRQRQLALIAEAHAKAVARVAIRRRITKAA